MKVILFKIGLSKVAFICRKKSKKVKGENESEKEM